MLGNSEKYQRIFERYSPSPWAMALAVLFTVGTSQAVRNQYCEAAKT